MFFNKAVSFSEVFTAFGSSIMCVELQNGVNITGVPFLILLLA